MKLPVCNVWHFCQKENMKKPQINSEKFLFIRNTSISQHMHGYEFSSDDNSCFNDSNITKKPRLKYVRVEESDRVDVKEHNIRRKKKNRTEIKNFSELIMILVTF